MATTVHYETLARVQIELPVPANTPAGAVVFVGDMPVFAQTAADANNRATCSIPSSLVVKLAVKGENASGNAAIAQGARVFLDGSLFNADATNGKPVGYVLSAVASGATTTVDVALT